MDACFQVNAAKPSKPLKPFWNATGYANADFTYTEAFGRMYDYLSSYHNHMRYMRLHNILTLHGEGDRFLLECGMDYGNRRHENDNRQNGDDKVVAIAANGELSFRWDLVDRVYDRIVEHHMVPIVELIYIPSAIRKSDKQFFLPSSYPLYAEVIKAFTEHCVERYGAEAVREWYFEIWNEPDGIALWREDLSTFLALYDYMEHAIHSVDPALRVGGPATKQFDHAYPFFEGFVEHCANGVNYCTGGYGTRLDFISVHCKGGWPDSYNPSSDVMFNAMKRYLEILENYPQYKDTEFFNDESDIVWAGCRGIKEHSWLDFRNTHYAPGFVCKMVSRYCYELEDAGVNLAIVDSDNAHLQWERSLFSGNRSQLTPLGTYPTLDILKKSFFNAYVLLSRLGDERLDVHCEHPDYNRKFGIVPTRTGAVYSVMVWNFEDGISDVIGRRRFALDLQNAKAGGRYHLVEYRIDAEHSNANHHWHAMGSPTSPTVEEIKSLRARADLEPIGPVATIESAAHLQVELDLPQHAVSLLVLAPDNSTPPKPVSIHTAEPETGYNGNPQVFLAWTPNDEEDFLYYRLLRSCDGSAYQTISDRLSLNTATYVDMEVEAGRSYCYRVVSVNMSMAENEGGEEAVVRIGG